MSELEKLCQTLFLQLYQWQTLSLRLSQKLGTLIAYVHNIINVLSETKIVLQLYTKQVSTQNLFIARQLSRW